MRCIMVKNGTDLNTVKAELKLVWFCPFLPAFYKTVFAKIRNDETTDSNLQRNWLDYECTATSSFTAGALAYSTSIPSKLVSPL